MQFTDVLTPERSHEGAESEASPGSVGAAGEARLAFPRRSPWGLILTVGSLCWLVVSGTAIVSMLPWSGTTTARGDWVISTGARLAQHLSVFIVAVLGYRVAIALGWPERALARTRVLVFNLVLALAACAWSDVALALAAGFVDGHMKDMRETFIEFKTLPPSLMLVTAALQAFLLPYVLGLCAIALVAVTRRQHREALRAAELARAYDAARLAMLSAQLQPHFLFNSLNAVIGLIEDNPRQAATMLVRLGDFLRHALETSQSPWVAVATELAGLEAYLGVQQTRFSDRLSISIDASPESLGVYLPSMLLQPLVENAIEHGRSDGAPTLRLRVAASVSAEHLCIVVNNSSPQLPADLTPADYGHGLSNVDLRLRAAYGGAAHLGIGPDQQGGTSAILVLPVRRRPGRSWPMGVPA